MSIAYTNEEKSFIKSSMHADRSSAEHKINMTKEKKTTITMTEPQSINAPALSRNSYNNDRN